MFCVASAQNQDSLKNIITTSKQNTLVISASIQYGEMIFYQAPDSARKYWTLAKNLCLKYLSENSAKNPLQLWHKRQLGAIVNNMALFLQMQGQLSEALIAFNETYLLMLELGDKESAGMCLNNMGSISIDLGNESKAIEYHIKALKLHEEIGNKSGMSKTLNNLAYVFEDQNEIEKALEYYERALKLSEEINDEENQAVVLNNIGMLYKMKDQFIKSIEMFNKGLELRRKMKNKSGIATLLCNIGLAYFKLNDPKCLEYYNEALAYCESTSSKQCFFHVNGCFGSYYLSKKNYSLALKYQEGSMTFAKESNNIEYIKRSARGLYLIYKEMGNYKRAMENYELLIKLQDSISNESTRKASIKSQLKYEYEKQAAADSIVHAKESEIKNVQLEKQETEIKAKKNQQYALFGGLTLVIIFAGFMYNRFKITQKQKLIIEAQKYIVEEQKKLVEEKQKEVLDSIHYAKRIQQAHLPNNNFIEKQITRLKG